MITKRVLEEDCPCGKAVTTQYIDDEKLDNGANPPGLVRQDMEIQVSRDVAVSLGLTGDLRF